MEEGKEGRRQIFRTALLTRGYFEKPELMRVTSSRAWLALGGAALVMLSAVIWSIFGTIEVKVTGQGMFLLTEGMGKIVAPDAGEIKECSLKVGDTVKKGQIVITMFQPEFSLTMQQTRADYQRATELLAEAQHESYRRDIQLKLAANKGKRESLTLLNQASKDYLRRTTEKAEAQEKLVQEGLITPNILSQTKRDIYETQDKIRLNEIEITRISGEDAELVKNYEERIKTLKNELADAQHRMEHAESKVKETVNVVSAFSGTVTEVLTYAGQRVTKSAPLVNIELAGSGTASLKAVIFVPAREGIKVKPAMACQMSPSFVLKEEYGYIMAKITEVGRMPVSRDRMFRLLNNEAVVNAIAGAEVSMEIHAELIPAADTVSGYKWSSSKGYPGRIESGALLEARIVTERRRPITMIIPYLKKKLGITDFL
jgi:HlyD family secretion protein